MQLRYVIRDGEKVLQQQIMIAGGKNIWKDIELHVVEEDNRNLTLHSDKYNEQGKKTWEKSE